MGKERSSYQRYLGNLRHIFERHPQPILVSQENTHSDVLFCNIYLVHQAIPVLNGMATNIRFSENKLGVNSPGRINGGSNRVDTTITRPIESTLCIQNNTEALWCTI